MPRYVTRDLAEFARLMDDRRSAVMGRMPVGLYLGLTGLAHRVPVVETSVRRLVSLFRSHVETLWNGRDRRDTRV